MASSSFSEPRQRGSSESGRRAIFGSRGCCLQLRQHTGGQHVRRRRSTAWCQVPHLRRRIHVNDLQHGRRNASLVLAEVRTRDRRRPEPVGRAALLQRRRRGSGLITGDCFIGASENKAILVLTPVPEPASYPMLLVGLAGLGIYSRRRRQR